MSWYSHIYIDEKRACMFRNMDPPYLHEWFSGPNARQWVQKGDDERLDQEIIEVPLRLLRFRLNLQGFSAQAVRGDFEAAKESPP